MRHLTLSLHSKLHLFKGWRNTAGGIIQKVRQLPLGLCLTHVNVFFVGKSVGEECISPSLFCEFSIKQNQNPHLSSSKEFYPKNVKAHKNTRSPVWTNKTKLKKQKGSIEKVEGRTVTWWEYRNIVQASKE